MNKRSLQFKGRGVVHTAKMEHVDNAKLHRSIVDTSSQWDKIQTSVKVNLLSSHYIRSPVILSEAPEGRGAKDPDDVNWHDGAEGVFMFAVGLGENSLTWVTPIFSGVFRLARHGGLAQHDRPVYRLLAASADSHRFESQTSSGRRTYSVCAAYRGLIAERCGKL
jgi:hypothetical protein